MRACRPRTVALPYWNDRHPDHRAASEVLTRAVFKSGLRRFAPGEAPAWRADWLCYYFINDADPASFAIDVSAHYAAKRAGARVPPDPVHAVGVRRHRDPPDRAAVSAAHRKPRRAARRARRRRVRRRARSSASRCCVRTSSRTGSQPPPSGGRPLNIAIVCYASVGGSGIVATELAKSLAARGHDVHVLSADTPFRLGSYQAGLTFHRVHTPAYPLFREPQYLLALATRIVQVSRDYGLDIVHAHYAVPHATAAYLAKQILLVVGAGPRAAGHHDAARDGHHAGRQRSLVFGDGGVLDRAVRRRDRRVRKPPRRHLPRAGGAEGDRRHPEFSGLRSVQARPEPGAARALLPGGMREARHPHLELPAGEARRGRRRGLRADRVEGPGPAAARRRRSGPVRRRSTRPGRSAWRSTSRRWGSRIRFCRCCRSPICSCCRRRRRASASPRSRRWRARCRWSRRASAACTR